MGATYEYIVSGTKLCWEQIVYRLVSENHQMSQRDIWRFAGEGGYCIWNRLSRSIHGGYPHTVGVVCVEDDLICYQRSKLKHVFRI
jgi:hypothetical protein